jgi:hypothetical protein
MTSWNSMKWLVWMGLYLIPAIILPMAISRSWVHQHGRAVQFNPKNLFERGELGLFSLILSSSVIWNLMQSQYMPHTIALASIIMVLGGIMALTVWIEAYCRRQSGTDWHPARAWKDSRNLALLVFSMAAVLQVLLDRLAKVTAS